LAPERAGLLLKSRFTARQEAEALRGSLSRLAKAGYDPREGLRLQEFFLAQVEAHRAGWPEGMLKRHPLFGNDLKALERESGALAGAVKRTGNGEFNQALKRLRANLPGYVLYDEARALERGGQLREAVATYLRAATAAPEESIILAALGTAYLQAGDLGSARLHLAKAVALDQRYYYSRMGLGYAHLQQGGTAAAIAELEASLRLLPSQRAAFLLAEAYEKKGKIPAARQFYRAVAEADSRSKLGKFAAERLRFLEE
jgi:predicted Zn-dependent protease